MDPQFWLQQIHNHNQTGDIRPCASALAKLSDEHALNDSNLQAIFDKMNQETLANKGEAWIMASELSGMLNEQNKNNAPERQLDTNAWFNHLIQQFDNSKEMSNFCDMAKGCGEQGLLKNEQNLERLSHLTHFKTEQGGSLLTVLNETNSTQDQQFYKDILNAANKDNPMQYLQEKGYLEPEMTNQFHLSESNKPTTHTR